MMIGLSARFNDSPFLAGSLQHPEQVPLAEDAERGECSGDSRLGWPRNDLRRPLDH
jgi:hypothetical protein